MSEVAEHANENMRHGVSSEDFCTNSFLNIASCTWNSSIFFILLKMQTTNTAIFLKYIYNMCLIVNIKLVWTQILFLQSCDRIVVGMVLYNL